MISAKIKALDFRPVMSRLKRDTKGVAAVEFALILPLMITLYIGSAEVTQGVLASRKLTVLSRTLSDLVAQQADGTAMTDAAMTSIFYAATAIMTPFTTANFTTIENGASATLSSLTMTISSVSFVANGTATAKTWNGFDATLKWSVTAASPNSGTQRSCAAILSYAENNAAPSATTIPKGLYAAGSLIVADVTYKYKPAFGEAVLAWIDTSQAYSTPRTYVAMSNTTYMRPRNWTTSGTPNYINYPTASTYTRGTSCTG